MKKDENKKKKIIGALAVLLIIGVSSFGTLAYLTSKSETASNTFTVGDVQIKLDEALTNEMGEPIDGPVTKEVVSLDNAPRIPNPDDTNLAGITGNEYKLLPGHTYTKDPTVTVLKDSEDCFVRVKVTINKKTAFANLASTYDLNLEDLFIVDSPHKWAKEGAPVTDPDNPENLIYEFRYIGDGTNPAIVPAATTDTKLQPLFKEIKIPVYFTRDDMQSLLDLKIDVIAEAIQADGFDDADTAWDMFDNPPSGPPTP